MRKRFFISFLCLFGFCIGLWICKREEILRVKTPVPLFKTEKLKHFLYYTGPYGNSCRDLMTVLLPGSFLEVLSENKEGVCKVLWLRNKDKEKGCIGFVARKLLKTCCEKVQKEAIIWGQRSPMPLGEIRKFFKRCAAKTIPYCWGGNWEDELKLSEDYRLEQMPELGPDGESNEPKRPYCLRGFDCVGLVYYVSNGILRRSCKGVRKHGKRLWTIDKENWNITREKLEENLKALNLQDTDLMVLGEAHSGAHLATWYDGGILEFRGVDQGCEYRKDMKEILDRIMRWIELCKNGEIEDIRFIRWHPELLSEKEYKELVTVD